MLYACWPNPIKSNPSFFYKISTQSNPTKCNPWMNPIHVQLWLLVSNSTFNCSEYLELLLSSTGCCNWCHYCVVCPSVCPSVTLAKAVGWNETPFDNDNRVTPTSICYIVALIHHGKERFCVFGTSSQNLRSKFRPRNSAAPYPTVPSPTPRFTPILVCFCSFVFVG